MHRYRTHTCGELRSEHVEQQVRLSGWVHNRRDLGGLLFVDLRDHYGLTQLVAQPESPVFDQLSRTPKETVVRISGTVKARSPENVNPHLGTGGIAGDEGWANPWRCAEEVRDYLLGRRVAGVEGVDGELQERGAGHAVAIGATHFDDARGEQIVDPVWDESGELRGQLVEGGGRAGFVDVDEFVGLKAEDVGEGVAALPGVE
jgi:hypothetical protein